VQKQTYQPPEGPVTGAFTESARTLQQIEWLHSHFRAIADFEAHRLDDESKLMPIAKGVL
jgi:hypothetical protein